MNSIACAKRTGKRIAVSNHAKTHMVIFRIPAVMLCDMIQNPIPCNSRKGLPHRKSARRICAMKKNVKYNIILDPFKIQEESCWVVANMEPLK
ncbi:MAG: hypothetical protein FWD92_03165 [Methanomassiliicoccaceae archaeon]|nr:hypothetical protein [Methanomassiliicoccaceae archaeon]